MKETQPERAKRMGGGSGILLIAILFVAMSVICYQAYQPGMTMWANDSHLGALMESSRHLPSAFTGEWDDMWWIGTAVPTPSPTVSLTLATFISPAMYLKIYAPFTMMVLGFSAWVLFRQLRFAPMVCVLGGLAAGLNTHCFSNACWGTGTWNISVAMLFLGVAAIVTDKIRQNWIKAVLAGLTAGMGVMEGFDSGAILSIYAGFFLLFFCWISQTAVVRRIAQGIGMGLIVVAAAGLLAASTLATLVGTQIKGVSKQAASPEALWDGATIWSYPKMETLRLIIPGLFGYRVQRYTTPPPPALASLMPFPAGRAGLPENIVDSAPAYWGKVGEDPQLTRLEDGSPDVRAAMAALLFGTNSQAIEIMRGNNQEQRAAVVELARSNTQARFTGNGEYAGVLTALFAIFAVLNSWRGAASPFNALERRLVWFWGGAAAFALVAAWGRFAPLYWFIYHLPFFSTIRNPVKFMHPFTVAWIILAGFGMEAVSRSYLREREKRSSSSKILDKQNWWQKLSAFDKKYLVGLLAVFAASVAGYLIYASSKPQLAQYLSHHGFDPISSARIAAFSIGDVYWFVVILLASVAVVVTALIGLWAGVKAGWAWGFFSVIMVFDMMRADVPWVRYFDAGKTYSMNDITQFLMEKPYEHRVTGRFTPGNVNRPLTGDGDFANAIYWWLENDFPAHDIQSLDIDQAPRSPMLDNNYQGYLAVRGDDLAAQLASAARIWKLTNTRYLLVAAQLLPALNQAVSPGREAFHFVKRFNLVNKPGVKLIQDGGDLSPQMSDSGSDALIEYSDALPRAKLYSHWMVSTNDAITLQALPNPQWNPDKSVIVSRETNDAPLPLSSADPNADSGTVEITHYSAKDKDIQLHASAKTPAVLLYNDRVGDGWNVRVDGKPSELLRCNYIMRGVLLPPGEHSIEFNFAPSLLPLCITLGSLLFGIVLLCYVCFPRAQVSD
jgi:hypothetical protein